MNESPQPNGAKPSPEVTSGEDTAPKLQPFTLDYHAGFHGKKPAALSSPVDDTREAADKLDEKCCAEAKRWLERYSAIPADNVVARTRLVIPEITALGENLRGYQSRHLKGGIALYLMLRDGLWTNITDQDGNRVYKSKKDFIVRFLAAFSLSTEEDRISRILNTAELWVLLVQGGVPVPPVLSRLEPILPVGLTEDRVWFYVNLVRKLGRVPTLQEIKDAVADHQADGDKADADGRNWIASVLSDAKRALALMDGGDPAQLGEAKEVMQKVVTVLKGRERKPAKKANAAAGAGQRPAPKDCPVRIKRAGRTLTIEPLGKLPPEVLEALQLTAHRRGFVQAESEGSWTCQLPPFPSAQNAREAHIREWLTRTLAYLGYLAPDGTQASQAA